MSVLSSSSLANPTQPATEEPEVSERWARFICISGVVGLLGLQVVIGVVAIYLAHSDASVAIIPNYYHNAVNWDATRRTREHWQDLGWHSEIQVGSVDANGRPLTLKIRTGGSDFVEGQRVVARLFHHARGNQVVRLKLQETLPGVYTASSPLTQSGLWQVELRVEGDHGVASESRELWVE